MTFHMNLGGMSFSIGRVGSMTYSGSMTIIDGQVVESTAAKTPREVLPEARQHHEDLQDLRPRCKTDAHRAALDSAIARSADLLAGFPLDGPMAAACMRAAEMRQLYEDHLKRLEPEEATASRDQARAPGGHQREHLNWRPLPAGNHGNFYCVKVTPAGVLVADRSVRSDSRASGAENSPEALKQRADHALGRLRGFVAEINERSPGADMTAVLDYQERAVIHLRFLEEALAKKTEQGLKEARHQGEWVERLAERVSGLAASLRQPAPALEAPSSLTSASESSPARR